MVKHDDLIIPVYLNQRVVFDLVAMLRGGIAAVTQVSETKKESDATEGEVGASFGLSKALSSLLRIDFSGKVAETTAAEQGETRSEQRIHTPASLFIALRAILREKNFVTNESSEMTPSPGSIIEFSAVLKRNPLLETIDSFVEMIEMSQLFAEKAPKGKGTQIGEMQRMKKQMESLVSALKRSDTMDLTTTPLASSHRCVITLEKQYLNDPSMSDLVDGTFRVVGKVIRSVNKGEGAISLNRKSALGRIPGSILDQFKAALEQPELQQFSLPKLEWEIPGPVIQLLPIAIFV
jgi:hypothetical protein